MANRTAKRLTTKGVAALSKPGRHPDGDGLYLKISPTGGKAWIFLFRMPGMRKEMGLGGITDVTLAEARELADIARKMVRSGKNPIIERKLGNRAVADTPTFRVFADAYVKSIESQWKNAKHRAQWKMTLEVYAAPLHDKLLCDIDTNDIHHVLTRDNLWNAKSETASRLRGRIETILDAARVKGYRKGENPARWEGHLEHLLGKRKKLTRGHFASMPYEELPDFISDLRTRTAKVARALEFHILCASRPGMVEQMLMTDVNFDERVWTIPKERMKLERDHMVPLSQRAIDILLEMKKTMRNNVVFYVNRRRKGTPYRRGKGTPFVCAFERREAELLRRAAHRRVHLNWV